MGFANDLKDDLKKFGNHRNWRVLIRSAAVRELLLHVLLVITFVLMIQDRAHDTARIKYERYLKGETNNDGAGGAINYITETFLNWTPFPRISTTPPEPSLLFDHINFTIIFILLAAGDLLFIWIVRPKDMEEAWLGIQTLGKKLDLIFTREKTKKDTEEDRSEELKLAKHKRTLSGVAADTEEQKAREKKAIRDAQPPLPQTPVNPVRKLTKEDKVIELKKTHEEKVREIKAGGFSPEMEASLIESANEEFEKEVKRLYV